MKSFIDNLVSHNLQNRKFVIVENGTWAATCGNQIRTELEKLKGSEVLEASLSLKSTFKKEQLTSMDNVVITIEKSLKV